MKAIVRHSYGPPDVLKLEALPTPSPGPGQVLVRIRAASVNAADHHLMRGHPFIIRLMYGGLRRPKIGRLGVDMAGEVEAVGTGVTTLRPGDRVFGELSRTGFGAFSEFAKIPEDHVVPLPAGVTFPDAAALPTAGLAALQGLRDKGRVRAGQKVLVNGASGGVGSFAVQLARIHEAEVTAVCRSQAHEMVRSLGADHVMDYTIQDPTTSGQRFDLILDAAGFRPFWHYRRILGPGGSYVLVGGAPARTYQTMLLGPLATRVGNKRTVFLMSEPKREDLAYLGDLLGSGQISPAIADRFTLDEAPQAVRRFEKGHLLGKVVILVPG